METRLLVLPLLLGALLVVLTAGAALAQEDAGAATAELRDNEGNFVGTAEFVEVPEGVAVTVNVQQGIEPGEHAIHIHESGDLSDPTFESAGGHFNPTDAQHGFENPQGPNAGDLENITVGEDGTAFYQTVNDRVTLGAGENSLLDEDGSALVIHAMADDYATDDGPEGPGNSGDRIAAGEIVAAASGDLAQTGGPNLMLLGALAIGLVLLVAGGGLLLIRRLLRRRA